MTHPRTDQTVIAFAIDTDLAAAVNRATAKSFTSPSEWVARLLENVLRPARPSRRIDPPKPNYLDPLE